MNGTVDPTTEGVDGDFYVNTTSSYIFGPKAAGAWGAGTSLVGPQGPAGPAGSLPDQAGHAGKYLKTDGTVESWQPPSVDYGDATANFTGELQKSGSAVLTQADTGTEANKVLKLDAAAKIPAVDGSQLTNLPPSGALVLLDTVTAASSATVNLETGIDSTYQYYLIVANDVVSSNNGINLYARLKQGGGYVSSGYRYHHTRTNSGSGTYTAYSSNGDPYIKMAQSIANSEEFGFEFSIYGPSNGEPPRVLTPE